jgi:O-antigen/teichoic acid export membrane protein
LTPGVPTSLTRKVAVNASVLAAGRAAIAAMGLVAVGVSTRYLGVDDYGALAAAIAFTSLVNLVTDVGIWNIGAREIAKRPGETQRIVGGLVTAGLAVSLVAAAVGVLATFVVYGGEDDELVRRGVLLLLLTLPFAAPYGAASAYFIARQQPYLAMLASVIASVVTLAGLAAASALDWGFTGIVLVYVAAAAVQGVVVLVLAAGKVRLRPTADLRLARQLLGWALPLGGAMLIGGLYWRIDIVLLSTLAANAEVGLYGLAYRMVDALVTLPGFVLITLLPEFARLGERRERFDEIVQKAFGVMQVGALAVFVPFVIFASEITELIGGEDFREAAPVLQLLMVGVALSFMSATVAQAIIALNRQRTLLPLTVVLLAVNVALNLAFIPPWGATGAALAFALSEVVHLVVIVSIYRRFARAPRPWKGARVLAAGCAMAAAAVVKLLPVAGEGGLVLTVALGGAVGLALYVGALYALRAMPPEVDRNLVRPLWGRLRPRLSGVGAR